MTEVESCGADRWLAGVGPLLIRAPLMTQLFEPARRRLAHRLSGSNSSVSTPGHCTGASTPVSQSQHVISDIGEIESVWKRQRHKRIERYERWPRLEPTHTANGRAAPPIHGASHV